MGILLQLFSLVSTLWCGGMLFMAEAIASLKDRLRKDVEYIAGHIGERNLYQYAALLKAERY